MNMNILNVGDLVYAPTGFLPGVVIEKKSPHSILSSLHTERLSNNYQCVYYVLFPDSNRKEGPYYESELTRVPKNEENNHKVG